MTNSAPISSISLNFNDSWLIHPGSRIYRLGVEMIEWISNAFSYPLIQPYAGKRLYQLVDTFRQSISKSEPYNEARLSYASGILTALSNEKNILRKTKQARTILNTHIIGLSILQDKNKKSLSGHIGYTLMPSLINDFGMQMANKAYLALDTLKDSEVQKNLHQYSRLYEDLRLDQADLDSFVKALQELNENVPRDILIHELILSRNKHLTPQAKDKIISTLEDKHYIDVRLQKKLYFMTEDTSQVDEREMAQELKTNRDIQVKALRYEGPSLFFQGESPVVDEDTGITFEDALEFVQDSTDSSESVDSEVMSGASTAQSTSQILRKEPTRTFESPGIPVGIANFNQSCWYNSALQILNNTSLVCDILEKKDFFSKNFPMISESFQLYQSSYLEQSDMRQLEHPARYGISEKLAQFIEEHLDNDSTLLEKIRSYRARGSFDPLDLTDQMQGIRSEVHHKIDKEFESWGAGQEDSKQFLFRLLEKLSIDVSRTTVYGDDLHTLNNKYILIDKPASEPVSLETLFAGTDYTTEGIIFHTRFDTENIDPTKDSIGHYFAAVKRNNVWYLCNDAHVQKISFDRLEDELSTNSAFIVATRLEDVDLNDDVDGSEDTATKTNAIGETSIAQNLFQRIISPFWS